MKNKEQYIPIILRVVVGSLWIWMAIVPKLINPEPRIAMVSKSWIEPLLSVFMGPETFIYILAFLELITGLMLLVGWFTRVASSIQIGLIIAIIVGLFNIATAQGLTSPIAHLLMKDLPLMAINVVLIITGGGLYSIDNWLKNKKISSL